MGKTLVNLVGPIDLPDDCLDLIFGFLGTKCTLCRQMPFISVNLEDRFAGQFDFVDFARSLRIWDGMYTRDNWELSALTRRLADQYVKSYEEPIPSSVFFCTRCFYKHRTDIMPRVIVSGDPKKSNGTVTQRMNGVLMYSVPCDGKRCLVGQAYVHWLRAWIKWFNKKQG